MIKKLIVLMLGMIVVLAGLTYWKSQRYVNIDFEPFSFAPLPSDGSYSFFIAGHVYGHPFSDSDGFHPPFNTHLENLISTGQLPDFGVLTGDVVRNGTQEQWNEIRNDIVNLDIPVHMAVGNHDWNAPRFEAHIDSTYYSFRAGPDLFIILDPNLDGWNIADDQLAFLKNTLAQTANTRHIFVFSHQLIWWTPDTEYSCHTINSAAGRAETVNFKSEILPLLKNQTSDVYWFAGDVGAFVIHPPFYTKDNNVHLVASGMGGGNGNYLIANVGDEVDFDLHWLHTTSSNTVLEKAEFIAENRPNIEDYASNCP